MTTASILLTRVDSARPGGCRRVGIRPSRLPPPSRPSSRAPNCEEGIVGRGRGECQHRTGESVSNLKPNGRGSVEEGLGGGDGGLEDLRNAVRAFIARYNAQWLIEKNGHLSPHARRRQHELAALPMAA